MNNFHLYALFGATMTLSSFVVPGTSSASYGKTCPVIPLHLMEEIERGEKEMTEMDKRHKQPSAAMLPHEEGHEQLQLQVKKQVAAGVTNPNDKKRLEEIKRSLYVQQDMLNTMIMEADRMGCSKVVSKAKEGLNKIHQTLPKVERLLEAY